MTEHERTVAAAAYVIGVSRGLSIDRTATWQRSVRKSWLVESQQVYDTAKAIVSGQGAWSPILIYEMLEAAKLLGFNEPDPEARGSIAAALTSKHGPSFINR